MLAASQQEWLARDGYDVETATDEYGARRLMEKTRFDLVLSDVRLPRGNGIALLEWLIERKRLVPFVLTTGYGSFPDTVKAIALGAKDYLPKPVFREDLLRKVRRLLDDTPETKDNVPSWYKRNSPRMVEVERLVRLVAPLELSVLVLGANGTGKESVARSIHALSARGGKPFIAVNCAAIPPEIAASLFFGHAKGAFTGAETAKTGYFEEAEGGTLFLDEIGTLPYVAQGMLLRVLQERAYMPVGAGKERRTDVRIVAATNEDLRQAVADGRFREDLFHRLAEFEIHQPSLAECPEDILPMADFFRADFSSVSGHATEGFSEDAKRLLLSCPWKGNIRELHNKVKQAVLVATQPLITASDLDLQPVSSSATGCVEPVPDVRLKGEEREMNAIVYALKSCGGNKRQAAGILNIDLSTLYRKIKKYALK